MPPFAAAFTNVRFFALWDKKGKWDAPAAEAAEV